MQQLDQVVPSISRLRRCIAVGNNEAAANHACQIIKNIFENTPTLGLDIDGTIDENPRFFSLLSKTWPGAVIVITFRADKDKVEDDLLQYAINYDLLILVDKIDGKADAIKRAGVDVYIDDQDECLLNIPDSVTVMKIRNGGNFNNSKWLYSKDTGTQI